MHKTDTQKCEFFDILLCPYYNKAYVKKHFDLAYTYKYYTVTFEQLFLENDISAIYIVRHLEGCF